MFGFILAMILLYLKEVYTIYKWKNEVVNYLNEIEKHRHFKLTLTDNFIKLNYDDKEVIEKWNTFSSFESSNEFISLTGNIAHMFPKKTMSDKDYNFLRKTISEKLK